MTAAVYRAPRELAVETRPLPEPGPEEVLLRVSHCGICGTDLHMVMEGWGRPDSIGGHEYAGHVVAVGAGVRDWQPGAAVVGGPEAGCGACDYCRAHRPGLCVGRPPAGVTPFQGAFAEYKCVPAAQLERIPDGMPLRVAALTEPLAVALHAITLSGIRPGQRALVTGAGPIGALIIASLRARGIDDVTVSEPSPVRRRLAEEIGARRAVEPDALHVPRMPFEIAEDPCDVAFECSGQPRAFRAALARLRKAGALVIVGSGMERPKLDTNRILLNELTVTGAYNYDENGFRDALALLASGKLPVERLIDPEDVPLSGMLRAMERLVAGEIGGKVMVVPRRGD
jgi:(R,R)-butanediol dehydrogenase/meso-butanediol dehydrogenase/diacetyl reductase